MSRSAFTSGLTSSRTLAGRDLATYLQGLALPSGHPSPVTGRFVSQTSRARRWWCRRLTDPTEYHSIGVEAQGWAQMLHFVSLGIGVAVVNGCLTPHDDLVTGPIDDLPLVTYSAILRKYRLTT
jgi:LysR family transcriptional regulator, low CO2-responsive transcriptional regulator